MRSNGLRYDPIEDDPAIQPLLAKADQEASQEYPPERAYKGYYPIFWPIKKRILKDKYGIDWQTPRELNPNWAFD
jgi:hypothetical protein